MLIKRVFRLVKSLPKEKPGRCRQAFLAGVAILLLLTAGCTLKAPPEREEIQQQALEDVELPGSWAAGGMPGGIADNWLASFDDEQLLALGGPRL